MPTKGTSIITARVKDEVIKEIDRRVKTKKTTRNAWINNAIDKQLRKR